MIAPAVPNAKWAVHWLGKQGTIVEKKFGTDFASALHTYTLLHDAGKKWVTLRCCNAGFTCPYTDEEMLELNMQGRWWCPYCIKLRKFYRDTDEGRKIVMKCPVCEITNYNFHVKRWNPKAKTLERRGSQSRNKKLRRRIQSGRT